MDGDAGIWWGRWVDWYVWLRETGGLWLRGPDMLSRLHHVPLVGLVGIRAVA